MDADFMAECPLRGHPNHRRTVCIRTVYFHGCSFCNRPLLGPSTLNLTYSFIDENINLVESSLKPWRHKLEAKLKLLLWVRLVDIWTAFSSLFIHTFVPLEVVSLDPRDYQPLLYYVIFLYLLVLITSLKDIGPPKLCQKFRTHAPLRA